MFNNNPTSECYLGDLYIAELADSLRKRQTGDDDRKNKTKFSLVVKSYSKI